jgi:hypothetical protein
MRSALTTLMILAFSLPVVGQPLQLEGVRAIEEEVRTFLTSLITSLKAGDPQAYDNVTSNYTHYSPGGVNFLIGKQSRRGRPMWKQRSILIRHIRVATPDVAMAIAVWRDLARTPPHDAGLMDLVLVREGSAWKLHTLREGYVTSLHAVKVASMDAVDGSWLSAEDRAAGWEALFDGRSSTGWTTLNGDAQLPDSWRIVEGSLATTRAPNAFAIRTQRTFRNYELRFEWNTAAKGNSGIKYRLLALEAIGNGVMVDGVGAEYQVADDQGDPGAKIDARQKSGSLYGIVPVSQPAARAPGEWNESRIVVTEDHVEHWLNGVETARYAVDVPLESPIVLQHHNSEVRFRNLRIRERKTAAAR